jgi:hypothetical protein
LCQNLINFGFTYPNNFLKVHLVQIFHLHIHAITVK